MVLPLEIHFDTPHRIGNKLNKMGNVYSLVRSLWLPECNGRNVGSR